MIRAKKSKSIHDVLEEVEVLIDTHFFDEFSGTKSASFLNKLIDKQGPVTGVCKIYPHCFQNKRPPFPKSTINTSAL